MRKAFIQLHIAVFLAGFTGILGWLIKMNEGMLVWYRLLFTAVTMWILFSFQKKITRIPARDILKIAFVGLIAMLHWVTFYASIKYSNVSVALVCFSAIGFFTALFEPLVLRRGMNWTELILGIITIGGIYIIFHFDSQYKTGIIIGIISSVLASLFPIMNRELLKRINVETMLAWQQAAGLVFLSALLPFYLQRFPTDHFLPTLNDFAWLLVLSWFCSVWAFQLSSNALKKLSAYTVNLTYSLEPVYGILLAFIVKKENEFLSNSFYAGLAVIMGALAVHIYLLVKAERQIVS